MRAISKIAPDWWDYTTLDREILDDAIGLTPKEMISKRIPDSSVPMSLLADHPNVQFNYLRPNIGTCRTEMH